MNKIRCPVVIFSSLFCLIIIIISLFRMAPIQRQRRRGLHTIHQVRLQQFRKSLLRFYLLCLTLSSTKWYNLVPANGRWCSAARKVTAGLAESNGSLLPGLWLQSPAGWLPSTGISPWTLRSFRAWDYLYLMLSLIKGWCYMQDGPTYNHLGFYAGLSCK